MPSSIYAPSPEFILGSLNHAEVTSDHPYFDCIPVAKRDLITALEKQSRRWSKKPYFRDNLQGRRIAVLNDYSKSATLSDCMMIKRSRLAKDYKRCMLDWFCEFCAYLKGQELLKKYACAWTPQGWYHMVFSLQLPIDLADPDRDGIEDVFDAMLDILKKLKEAGDWAPVN